MSVVARQSRPHCNCFLFVFVLFILRQGLTVALAILKLAV